MTRKSRVISAIAIAAAGALMITTTAYQSKAADPTGVAATWADYETDDDFNAINNLNTTSTGTFRYDAPGTDEDIEIASGDIKSLESAVKGLARQVTSLGNKAKAADTTLETDVTTAVASAKDAITSDIANIETAIGSLNTTITNDDATIKSDLSTLKTNVNSIKSTVNSLNTAITNGGGSNSNVIKTDAGNASTGILYLSGSAIAQAFPVGGNGTDYLIWSGRYTVAELLSGVSNDGVNLKNYTDMPTVVWTTGNQQKGLMGRLVYGQIVAGSSNVSNYNVTFFDEDSMRTLRSDMNGYLGGEAVYYSSIFTLAPLVN